MLPISRWRRLIVHFVPLVFTARLHRLVRCATTCQAKSMVDLGVVPQVRCECKSDLIALECQRSGAVGFVYDLPRTHTSQPLVRTPSIAGGVRANPRVQVEEAVECRRPPCQLPCYPSTVASDGSNCQSPLSARNLAVPFGRRTTIPFSDSVSNPCS